MADVHVNPTLPGLVFSATAQTTAHGPSLSGGLLNVVSAPGLRRPLSSQPDQVISGVIL